MTRTYESCHRCRADPGPEPYTPAAFDTIHYCGECGLPLCQDCADVDVEYVGDPPGPVATVRCDGGCAGRAS
jgi:hypothetical protein